MNKLLGILLFILTFLPLTASAQTVVWSADMETGNLSQWTIGGTKGGSFDSGNCTRPTNGVATTPVHGGSFSMEMTIDTTTESGCRQFRNQEPEAGGTYYYSAWFYIPVKTLAHNYWNIFQFKSNDGSTEDPFWVVDLMPNASNNMHLRLRWKEGHAGPFSNSGTPSNPIFFDQSILEVPVATWFQIKAYLLQSGTFTGHLTIWQDGTQLWDFANINTRFSNGDQRWSTNNYSDGLNPSPATLFVDDAAIATPPTGSSPVAPTGVAAVVR